MATPKTLISETFYHKTACLRFELGSYKDATKFKIEIAPQLQQNGQPVEKRFDYEQKLSMVFGLGEILRIKRFTENLLNPQKQVPADGYVIEHFFEVDGQKKKSCLFMKRVENLLKSKPELWAKDPYQFAHSITVTLYSSMKEKSTSFVLSSEEAYWIINEMPFFAWAFQQESARIVEENRTIKASGGTTGDTSGRSPYRAPAPGADFAGEAPPAGTPAAFPSDSAFDDIPF
jgi:hypothetical protein